MENPNKENSPLEMSFDPSTIEHLGIKMYSTVPPVLAELIANAYDADATEVKINLVDSSGTKEIQISDNGHGMSLEDINDKFLRIGRNRREEGDKTPNGRKPIGKKGLGKLSFFGIAEDIEVSTTKDGLRNTFLMRWADIKASDKVYKPVIQEKDVPSGEGSGTVINLKGLRRITDFNSESLAISLSKIFITDKEFSIIVSHNGGEPVQIENEKKYHDLDKEVEWEVQSDIGLKTDYKKKDLIEGHLISTEKPISPKTNMRGVTLFSRNKMVNAPEYFSESTSSHFYSYLTGYLKVDFIDELDDDVIGTDRQSLNWGHPDMAELREYLRQLMNWLERDWREKRSKKRIEKIDEKAGIKTAEWFGTMPDDVRSKAEAVVKAIVQDAELPEELGVAAVRNFHALVPEYPRYHWRNLHPEVKDASKTYYQAGDYYHAFLEASKRYVDAVRNKAQIPATDNSEERAIMEKVFPHTNPVLSVSDGYKKSDGSDFTDKTLKNIREAHFMFSIAIICGGRHPLSHEEIQELRNSELFTEEDCLDILSLLSHLFWRLEHSTKIR